MAAQDTKYFLEGVEVKPVDSDAIGFTFEFDEDLAQLALNVTDVKFNTLAAAMVESHIVNVGLQNIMRFTAQQFSDNNLQVSETLNYFIDFLDESPVFDDHGVEASVVLEGGIRHFYKMANSATYSLINDYINMPDPKDVPCVVVPRDQRMRAILAIIMIAINAVALANIVQKWIAAIALASGVTTIPASVASIAALVVETATVLASLVLAAADIFRIMFPKKRYLKAYSLLQLVEIGIEFLNHRFGFNYTLSSNLLNARKREYILPVPARRENESIFEDNWLDTSDSVTNYGYPSALDGDLASFGGVIQYIRNKFNAQLRIIGDTVYIENKDFFQDIASTTIDVTLNNLANWSRRWTFNTNESWKRYLLSYKLDGTDVNTFDKVDGVSAEFSTEPLGPASDDVSLQRFVDVMSSTALGRRKESLTTGEQAVANILGGIDAIINIFAQLGGNSGGSNLASGILERKGYLQISDPHFGVPKSLWLDSGGKQPENYLNFIGMKQIFYDYHQNNQVKENNKRVYMDVRTRMSPSQFLSIVNNNYVYDQNGVLLEITSMDWVNESRIATISFAVSEPSSMQTQTVLVDG